MVLELLPAVPLFAPVPVPGPKMSQKRIVSSALALQIVAPSGDRAKCRTRLVCPWNSRSFVKLLLLWPYFHRIIWLSLNPCEDTNSFSVKLH